MCVLDDIRNKSFAEAYIKNAYICLNLAENKIMPRHDCLWNTRTPGGLSNVLQNSFNVDDNVTSAAEEYDYDSVRRASFPPVASSDSRAFAVPSVVYKMHNCTVHNIGSST